MYHIYMLQELEEEYVDIPLNKLEDEIEVIIELPILSTCQAWSSYLTDFGEGAPSEVLTDIETLASGKPEIKPEYPKYPNCTSAVLSWKEPKTEFGEVLGYEVEIRQLSSHSEKPTNVFFANQTQTTWTFTGLRASQKYVAKIVPVIGVDYDFGDQNYTHLEVSELKGDFVIRELVTIPEIPTQPELVGISNKSVTLQLMELKNLHLPEEGDFRGFEVKFYKVNVRQIIKNYVNNGILG